MERRDKDIVGYLYNDHDKKLREQIAREIEAEGPWCDNPHHREEGRKSANDCPCYIFAAAIARGEG